jgi:hypothetical protein
MAAPATRGAGEIKEISFSLVKTPGEIKVSAIMGFSRSSLKFRYK